MNGQVEMAAAFHRAGFEADDVHMSDLLSGACELEAFRAWWPAAVFPTATCWARGRAGPSPSCSTPHARDVRRFFERPDSFTLGVCNGCQMMARLKQLIPGSRALAALRAQSIANSSRRVSAQVEILDSPSMMFARHGRVGPADRGCPWGGAGGIRRLRCGRHALASGLVASRYVDSRGAAAERYPANPNGSPLGITALTSVDGRVTIMMPHPERVFRTVQNSWYPADWGEYGRWMRMFRNARVWVN